jgi:hypothetical protein
MSWLYHAYTHSILPSLRSDIQLFAIAVSPAFEFSQGKPWRTTGWRFLK